MNLILDLGNTTIKYAIFANDNIRYKNTWNRININDLKKLMNEYPRIQKAIISSVIDYSSEVLDYLKNILDYCIELDKNTDLPIENLYQSKDTLGYDRIADVVGAAYKFPRKNILVIDSGTAITYDLINSNGQYLGGAISPGADMRVKALNKFAAKLPLVDLSDNWSFPEKTTEEAIISGVLSGIVYEIDGYIVDLKHNYPDLTTVLTGGNLKLFDKKLKSIIFVDSNLNLYGLNRILEYNAK
ncbi:MAG: type III pantothenate kinase [Bacteroidota bacterium]